MVYYSLCFPIHSKLASLSYVDINSLHASPWFSGGFFECADICYFRARAGGGWGGRKALMHVSKCKHARAQMHTYPTKNLWLMTKTQRWVIWPAWIILLRNWCALLWLLWQSHLKCKWIMPDYNKGCEWSLIPHIILGLLLMRDFFLLFQASSLHSPPPTLKPIKG